MTFRTIPISCALSIEMVLLPALQVWTGHMIMYCACCMVRITSSLTVMVMIKCSQTIPEYTQGLFMINA